MTTMGTEVIQPRSAALDANDRCDRCGAQAYVRVRLAGGSELLFCGHDFRANELPLKKLTVDIWDDTHKLLS